MPNDASADEPLYAYLVRKQRFRRVRSHEGKHWTPVQMEVRDTGMMCRTTCHRIVPYRNLECRYEMQGQSLMRLWVCECDTVLRTDDMSDLALVYEMQREDPLTRSTKRERDT